MASSSARSLLLTFLGELVLPHDGSVWTSTVVDGLDALGFGERNARQAVFRLVERGYLQPEKDGRRARLHLTSDGHQLLVDGAKRIYEFGSYDDTWDGKWVVVVCNVAEDQRTQRHRLRSQLGFAGFGFIAPGVAVSPHVTAEGTAHAILTQLDLLPTATVFRAETGALMDPADLLARAWDLDVLARDYRLFMSTFEGRQPRTDEAALVALLELVHAWRRFPFTDPELPDRLLPAGWPGRSAKALFDARHRAWTPAATAWYEAAELGRTCR